jgi:hypothetical protein
VNTNAVADEVLNYLTSKHSRSYRNTPPKEIIVNGVKVTLTFPYVVFRIDSGIDTCPSDDLYLNIDVYEKAGISVRTIEDLADTIDNGLNHSIIDTTVLNLQIEREQRQYVPPEELVSTHLVNLRYVVRAYFK